MDAANGTRGAHEEVGRDGREEAEELLQRRSGNPDHPRILGTFNEPCEEWLSFFCFTMFTDRDGKFQLLSLAESAFDPLARSCQFMLTEEAHHLFVGETGIARVVQRSAELTRQDPNGDAFRHGGVDLPVIQRYLNHWFSSCLDLFGGEVSSNAASYFATGLKGRPNEAKFPDHVERNLVRVLQVAEHDRLVSREVAARLAINEDVRDAYIRDCERAVHRWNRVIEDAGVDFLLRLPNRRFNRTIGEHAGHAFTPEGDPISAEELARRQGEWLPTADDRAKVRALQQKPIVEPGQFASWIAPPPRGINGQPVDFAYVRFD